jgi:hypothetical protein
MRGDRGKTIEIPFTLCSGSWIDNSRLTFTAKASIFDPDSQIRIFKSSDLGILFNPVTLQGMITIAPAETQDIEESELYCDLEMTAPDGNIYLLQRSTMKLRQTVRREP